MDWKWTSGEKPVPSTVVVTLQPTVAATKTGAESGDTIKKKLIIRLPTFAEQTTNIKAIVAELVSTGVLQWRERDIVLAEASDYDRTIEICKITLAKGQQAFDHLLAALRKSGNDHMADLLMEPLTAEEASQSFKECLLKLSIERAPKLGAAIHEMESFNFVVSTTNEFYLRINGMAGELGILPILTEYTVLDGDGKVLFFLLWKAVGSGLQIAGLRANSCEMFCPSKIGVTRICQNLIGTTIMEVNTEWGVQDIRIGSNYWGRIQRYSCLNFLLRFGIGGYLVLDRHDDPLYRVMSTWSGHFIIRTNSEVNRGQLVGKFGCSVKNKETKEKSFELKFQPEATAWLTPDDRMLLFGAAVMIIDLRTYDGVWTPRRKMVMILIVLALVVAAGITVTTVLTSKVIQATSWPNTTDFEV